MNRIYIPETYKPLLDEYDTPRAIAYIKGTFQEEFASALNLKRVSAPLFVTEGSGLNDNLNGYERPVSFDVPAVGADVQVVHSLAKWKRLALKRYHFGVGGGLYTDMNDFAAFNEVYARYFTTRPARSCVAVKTLPKNVLCEIEAIAVSEKEA